MPTLYTGIYVAVASAGAPRWPVPIRSGAIGPADASPPAARFSAVERNQLLLERGIGPITVERLERAGFSSIAALRQAGADRVAAVLAETFRTPGWRNRVRALDRIIHQAMA